MENKQNKSIHLCVLIDAWEPVWGGGQTHVWEINTRLVKYSDFTSDIFTRALKSDGKTYAKNEIYDKKKLRLFRVGPVADFFDTWARIFWLFFVVIVVWKKHRKKKYTLINAHAYSAGIPGKILSVLLNIPIVYTVHGSNHLDLKRNTFMTIFESILLTKIRYTHEISVSRQFLNFPNVNQITVISNGVDVSEYDLIPKRSSPSSKFRLLWVGRYDWVKGLPILLYALRRIVTKYSNIKLQLVGQGTEERTLKKMVSDLGLESYVEFKKKKRNLSLIKTYKEADLFVLPSLSEGQSLTLLEAWAAKLPVIVTKVGDNSTLVQNRVNGYVVEPDNIEKLSDILMQAIQNKKLEVMGRRGYQLVKKKFDWEQIVKQHIKIYLLLNNSFDTRKS